MLGKKATSGIRLPGHDIILGTKIEGPVWEGFAWFIKERASILAKRLDGKDWPWTGDPILRDGKFGNVWREQDRGSRWEIECMRRYSGDRLTQLAVPLLYRHNLVPRTTKAILDHGGAAEDILRDLPAGASPMHDCIKIWPGTSATQLEHKTREEWAAYCAEHAQHVFKSALFLQDLSRDPQGVFGDPHALWLEVQSRFPLLGAFKAYEVMTSWTYLDWWPWNEDSFVHPGHGATPMIRRLDPEADESALAPWIVRHAHSMRAYLVASPDMHWPDPLVGKERHKFTARTMEDCLCEYRKYVEVKEGKRDLRTREDKTGRWA